MRLFYPPPPPSLSLSLSLSLSRESTRIDLSPPIIPIRAATPVSQRATHSACCWPRGTAAAGGMSAFPETHAVQPSLISWRWRESREDDGGGRGRGRRRPLRRRPRHLSGRGRVVAVQIGRAHV